MLGLAGIIKLPSDMTPEEQVLKSYYHRLSVFQVKKSRVIAIEFESQDPQLAAQAANAVAETYLRFQQTVKQDQNRASGEWLSREIERLRANVAQAEAKVEQYRAKSSLFLGNNNTTLSNQQLGEAKPLERFAILAPNAVLIAPDMEENAVTALLRERLLKAGFANVSVIVEALADATGARVAA